MTPDQFAALNLTMRAATAEFAAGVRHAARAFRHLAFTMRLRALRANAVNRNGNPRRSGHRHRGTAAWDGRYATRRNP